MSVDRRSPSLINSTLLPNPGPYLARIVNNVDPMKQGALEVELLRPIGNQKEAGQQLFIVRYLSPFYGVTPLDATGTDPTEFNDTQKSYGFWAVPPDVGVTVMVIFVDSDPGQGFWIGCVQDALMNFMIPGIASSTFFQDKVRGNDDIEWQSVEQTKTRYGEEITKLPVGEVNRRIFKEGNASPNPNVEANKKPVHPLAERLLTQGLEKDDARGHTTSSARRESPSNVYGWSTPGPIDKRKGAKKGKIGKINDKIDKFVSRMGGHCIIMDDGNDRFLRKTRPWEGPPEYADLEKGEEGLVDFPMDEQIRIRTRKGAQILLHSSEDLIYITNSRGTAWMEFTSEGKIQMYAQDGVSFSSGGDVNFSARRDIQYTVGRNVHEKVTGQKVANVDGSITQTTKQSIFASADGDISHNAGTNMVTTAAFGHELKAQSASFSTSSYEWKVGGNLIIDCTGANFEVNCRNMILSATNEAHLGSDSDMRLSGKYVDIAAPGGDLTMAASKNAFLKTGASATIETGGSTSINSGAATNLTSKAGTSISSSDSSLALGGAGGKISIGGSSGGGIALKTSGGDLHLNGNEPLTPAAADKDITTAKYPVKAHYATGSASAGTSGGPGDYPIDLVGYTTEAGWDLNKAVPVKQPMEMAENKNPTRVRSEVTDSLNPLHNAPDGKQYTIKRNSDHADVGYDAGGEKDGTLQVAYRWGGETIANKAKSNAVGPVHKDYLERFPLNWAKDQEFLSKAEKVAGKFGLKKEDVLGVIAIETANSMNPSKRNPSGHRVGLIQMGKDEAKMVGTTTAALANMSRSEQMDYVEKYLDKRAGQYGSPKSLGDLYMLVAAPAKVRVKDDQEVYKRGSRAWHANPKWRYGGINGKITKRGITEAVQQHVDSYIKPALGSSSNKSGKNQYGLGNAPPPSNKFTPNNTPTPRSAPTPSPTPSPAPNPNVQPIPNAGTNYPWNNPKKFQDI